MVAEADRTLVVAGGLGIPGPLPADDRDEQTSHRDHRRIQRLAALLTAGLLAAACSGDNRSIVSPPPAAPVSTATTITQTVPAAPEAPTTAPPRSLPATSTVADRLAAQLTTAETAIRDPATPASKLPALAAASSGPTAPWSASRGWSPRSWPSSRPGCAGWCRPTWSPAGSCVG